MKRRTILLICLATLLVGAECQELHFAAVPATCDGVTCSGHGYCQLIADVGPRCQCDPGYVVRDLVTCVSSGDADTDADTDVDTDTDTDTDEPCWTIDLEGDPVKDIAMASDGRVAVTGTRDHKLWVAELDGVGGFTWEARFGAYNDNVGNSIRPTGDGGWVVTGMRETAQVDGGETVWVIKLDASGQTVWEQKYGGMDAEGGNAVSPTREGGYVVAAYREFQETNGTGTWLLELDGQGQRIAEFELGDHLENEHIIPRAVLQSSDGRFVVGGEWDGQWLLWRHDMDTGGGSVRQIESPGDRGSLEALLELSGGEFLAVGNLNNGRARAARLDSDLEVVWDRIYFESEGTWFNTLQPSDVGTYFASGLKGGGGWLVELDGLGDPVWEKQIPLDLWEGSPGFRAVRHSRNDHVAYALMKQNVLDFDFFGRVFRLAGECGGDADADTDTDTDTDTDIDLDIVWERTSNPSEKGESPEAIVAHADHGLYMIGDSGTGGYEDTQWRIEKRHLGDGWLLDGVEEDLTPRYDTPYAAAIDDSGIYVAGYTGSGGDYPAIWRIEKRALDDLAIMWVQEHDPASSGGIPYGASVDSTGVYIAGGQTYATGVRDWHIEKRGLQDGSLLWTRTEDMQGGSGRVYGVVTSGGAVFVTGGVNCGTTWGCWRTDRLDPNDGSSMWTAGGTMDSLPGTAKSIVADELGVYIAGYEREGSEHLTHIEKRDPDNGAIDWERTIFAGFGFSSISAAVLADDLIVVGNDDDSIPNDRQWRIERWSKHDGTLLWGRNYNYSSIDDRATCAAALGSMLFVGGTDSTQKSVENGADDQWRIIGFEILP